MPEESVLDFMARGRETKHPNDIIQTILQNPQDVRSKTPSRALPIVGAVLNTLLGGSNPVGAYSQMRGSQLAQHDRRDFADALGLILQEQGGEDFSRSQLGKIAKIRESYTGQVGNEFGPQNLSGESVEVRGDEKRIRYTNERGEQMYGEWVNRFDSRSGGLNEGQQNMAEYYKQVRNEWVALPKSRRDRYVKFMQGNPEDFDQLSDADKDSVLMYTEAFLKDKHALNDPNYLAMRADFLRLRRGDSEEEKLAKLLKQQELEDAKNKAAAGAVPQGSSYTGTSDDFDVMDLLMQERRRAKGEKSRELNPTHQPIGGIMARTPVY